MLRPAVWADVAHIPSTTFHYGEGQENVQFQLEEVVGEGTLALAPLPLMGGNGVATPLPLNGMDFHFGFDDISAPSLTPTSSLHFGVGSAAVIPTLGHHHHTLSSDSLASFSGDDSDVSSTPSTPPPLSPAQVFKQESIIQPLTSLLPHHYGTIGYPSPSSESFSSGPSTPDHTYELDPVPGVIPLPPNHPSTVDGHQAATPMTAYPITMPVGPSQNAPVVIPPSVGSSTTAARNAKRRRGATGATATPGNDNDSDDATRARMSWITAADAKLAAAAVAVAEAAAAANTASGIDGVDENDDDDDDTDGDKKTSGRRKGSGASAGGKQSKRERNKISASKYRKRRKQYLDGLEGKCNELTSQLAAQTKKINALTTENKLLKENVAFLKNLLGYNKDGKTSKDTHSHGHNNHDSFASHAGGGAAAATGVILFAFFACFILFTPPWQPGQLGGVMNHGNGGNALHGVSMSPNGNVIINEPISMGSGRLNRKILQLICSDQERNQTDDRDCCLCPGDSNYRLSATTNASPSPSPSSSIVSSTKEHSVTMDSGNAVATDPTLVVSSVLPTVNDTSSTSASLTDNVATSSAAAA